MELGGPKRNRRYQFSTRSVLIFVFPAIALMISFGIFAERNLRLDRKLRAAAEDLRSVGAFSDQQLRFESFVIYNSIYGPPRAMEVVVVYDDVGGGWVPITKEYFEVLRNTLRNISSIREVIVERPDFPEEELSELIAEFPDIRFFPKYENGKISNAWQERVGQDVELNGQGESQLENGSER